MQAAGFTVTGARDLDQATLRQTFREFLDQVAAAGPDAVALVYLAGYGLQFGGENYFVPVDADIQRDVDVPLQAVRISDFTQPLAAMPGRVKIVIVDAARQNPFASAGRPLASGLALVDPAPSMAIAFNTAPGTVAPDEHGPYGAYASALTEMIAVGGLSLDDIFARVRLRVSNLTQGTEVPWYASGLDGPFFMTELAAGAPPPPNATPIAEIRNRPMRDYRDAADAYAAALALDTIDGYQQFLTLFPGSPYAARIAAMLAVRREEIIWRHCVIGRYAAGLIGPICAAIRAVRTPGMRAVGLAMLGAQNRCAARFCGIRFRRPPPPPDELEFVDQPILIFEGPGFRPPPPPPVFFPAGAAARIQRVCRRHRRRASALICRFPLPPQFPAFVRPPRTRRRCGRHRRGRQAHPAAGRPNPAFHCRGPCSRARTPGAPGRAGYAGVRPAIWRAGRGSATAAASPVNARPAAAATAASTGVR